MDIYIERKRSFDLGYYQRHYPRGDDIINTVLPEAAHRKNTLIHILDSVFGRRDSASGGGAGEALRRGLGFDCR